MTLTELFADLETRANALPESYDREQFLVALDEFRKDGCLRGYLFHYGRRLGLWEKYRGNLELRDSLKHHRLMRTEKPG